MMKNLKSVTVRNQRLVNGEYEKFTLKVGDKIMHGSIGVLTVTEITQRDNKNWTRTVYMETNTGKRYAFEFDTAWNGIVDRFLFKIA